LVYRVSEQQGINVFPQCFRRRSYRRMDSLSWYIFIEVYSAEEAGGMSYRRMDSL
jgi:hypothetical protein